MECLPRIDLEGHNETSTYLMNGHCRTLYQIWYTSCFPKSALNVYTIRLHVHQLLLQVVEIKHYVLGLANIHLSNRGVVWKVNMAYDVLFNEVCILHKYRITVV